MTQPQFPPTYTSIKLSDPLMLILEPLLSNSTLLPVPVSDDLPDAILNPPAMSEPNVERPRQRLCRRPRRRPRRHPTPYVAVVPLAPVLAVMFSSSSLQLLSPCPPFFVLGEGSVTCVHLHQIVRVGRYY